MAASASDWSPCTWKYRSAMRPNTPANPAGMSPSSRRYDAPSKASPTCGPGVAVIFSAPITRAKRPRPAARKSRAPCTAADPDAQAFSYRVAGLNRSSGTAWMASELGKSCLLNPLLNSPMNTPSISDGATPASAMAAPATRATNASTSGSSRRPNGVCAHPTMHASAMTPSCGFAREASESRTWPSTTRPAYGRT